MTESGYIRVSEFSDQSIDLNMALTAYRGGYFPMGFSRDTDEYAWFTNIPRGVLPLNAFHISKSLQKQLNKRVFHVTSDTAFEEVIDACASGRGADDKNETWICHPIKNLFLELHKQGHAHSVECWIDDTLLGGLYGLHQGGVFFGESMFSNVSGASKVALTYLVQHLKQQGVELLDVQQCNPHTASMGAIEVEEDEYLTQLEKKLTLDVEWGRFHPHHNFENAHLPLSG